MHAHIYYSVIIKAVLSVNHISKVNTNRRPHLQIIILHLHISHNAPYLPTKILHKYCFQFLLGRL